MFLHKRKWVEDKTWRRFTLAGQSLGSMVLAWEAMSLLIPDLFIGTMLLLMRRASHALTDTMGYAFSFHVVQALGGIPVSAYVHYPTISSDMLARVASRKKWHTNADAVASSSVLSFAKLLYVACNDTLACTNRRKATIASSRSSTHTRCARSRS